MKQSPRQSGFSLVEVLITIIILAFGLLGLGGLQARVQTSQSESYQRAQALLLVQDMANRISANRANASSYLTSGTTIGTGDSQPADCSSLTGASKDICEWSNELKGAAETQGGSSVGAMLGARGCIDQIGSTPAVYRISVSWQGLAAVSTPSLSCGQGSYGINDAFRRVIAIQVPVACLTC
jgi:type IV pilus assembly protein PilV